MPVPSRHPDDLHAIGVDRDAATAFIALDDETKQRLEADAQNLAEHLLSLNVHAPAFGEEVNRIADLGRREIADAASQPHRFFARSLNVADGDGNVGLQLVALRRAIEKLDPSLSARLPGWRHVLRFVPFGSRLLGYVEGWQSVEKHVATILQRLASGKDEIIRDNLAIDDERQRLWAAIERLERSIHTAQALDAALERHLVGFGEREADRARAIRETALFYTRQRQQDLVTQMAVSMQGYLALAIVRRSNAELAKGIDRASTTTVAALRTAMSLSQAMTSQKRVLDQIETINSATAGIIDRTSVMLRSQTNAIFRQAANATISVDTLKRAFRNVYDALDAVDSSKIRALDSMKTAISALTADIEVARAHIAQVRRDGQPATDTHMIEDTAS